MEGHNVLAMRATPPTTTPMIIESRVEIFIPPSSDPDAPAAFCAAVLSGSLPTAPGARPEEPSPGKLEAICEKTSSSSRGLIVVAGLVNVFVGGFRICGGRIRPNVITTGIQWRPCTGMTLASMAHLMMIMGDYRQLQIEWRG